MSSKLAYRWIWRMYGERSFWRVDGWAGFPSWSFRNRGPPPAICGGRSRRTKSHLRMGEFPPNLALSRRWLVNGARYRISFAAIRGRMDGARGGSGLGAIPPMAAGNRMPFSGNSYGPLNGPSSRLRIPPSFIRPSAHPPFPPIFFLSI